MTAAPAGRLELTSELAPHAGEFLELEALTSEAFDAFVFGDAAAAAALRRHLFDRGVSDVAPPSGRLLLVDGAPAGMYAVLAADALRTRRLTAGLTTARYLAARPDGGELRRRFQDAAQANYRPQEGDAILARIAVAPRFAGRGYGAWLLGRAVEEAGTLGASRLVLDVDEQNAVAVDFYGRNGFTEVGRETVRGPSGEPAFTYLHLARPL